MNKFNIIGIALAHVLWVGENIYVFQKNPKTKGFRAATYISLVFLLGIKLIGIGYGTGGNLNYEIKDLFKVSASITTLIIGVYGIWGAFVTPQTIDQLAKKLLYCALITNGIVIINIIIYLEVIYNGFYRDGAIIRALIAQSIVGILVYRAYVIKNISPGTRALLCFLIMAIGKIFIIFAGSVIPYSELIELLKENFYTRNIEYRSSATNALFFFDLTYINIVFVIRGFAAWIAYAVSFKFTKIESRNIAVLLSTMFIANAIVSIAIM